MLSKSTDRMLSNPADDLRSPPASEREQSVSSETADTSTFRSVAKQIVGGTSTYGLGSILQRAVGFALIPIYTHYLTTADYGIVAVMTTLVGLLSVVLSFGLHGAVTRQYFDYEARNDEIRELLGTTFIFFLAASTLIALALTRWGAPLSSRIFEGVPFRPFVTLSIWAALFAASINIPMSLFRARKEPSKYVGVQLFSFLLTLALSIYLVVGRRQGALGRVTGGYYAGLATFIWACAYMSRAADLKFSPSKLRQSLAFGLPIIPHLLAAWALNVGDRVLLQRLAGLSEVGVYSLACQVAGLLALLVAAVNSAYTPVFYDLARNPTNASTVIGRITTVYFAIVAFSGLAITLFAKPVLSLIAPVAYLNAYRAVGPVTVGFLFQGLYFMTVTPIMYKRKTYILPILTAIAAASNFVLNFLWIPKHGMMGASYATAAGWGILLLMTYAISRREFAIAYEFRKLAVIGAAFVTFYWFGQSANRLPAAWGMILALAGSIGFVFVLFASAAVERQHVDKALKRILKKARPSRVS